MKTRMRTSVEVDRPLFILLNAIVAIVASLFSGLEALYFTMPLAGILITFTGGLAGALGAYLVSETPPAASRE